MTTTLDLNTFGSRLFNKVASALTGNVFVSPYSIQVALGMCAAGARGETRRVMADLLSVPEDPDEQNRLYESLIHQVNGDGSARDYDLVTANALWIDQSYVCHPAYLNIVRNIYRSALNQVDYLNAPGEALKQINAWVDEHTKHKIPTIVSPADVTRATRLVLTNAIYFKGQWDAAFDKDATQRENWDMGNSRYPVWMMNRTGGYLYHETDTFKALELPYKGGDLAMLIVLPNPTHQGNDLEVDADLYQRIVAGLQWEREVIVKLPRFKVETKRELSDDLQDMGAGLAFSGAADFSGIGPEPLIISKVIHKAYVDVTEEGTEAAAATAVVMGLACYRPAPEPKQFFCTHPFLYFIRNVKTNTVLFAGRLREAPKA